MRKKQKQDFKVLFNAAAKEISNLVAIDLRTAKSGLNTLYKDALKGRK